MSSMQRAGAKLGPSELDKPSVRAIEREHVDTWLPGPQGEAAALARLTPVEAFAARPAKA